MFLLKEKKATNENLLKWFNLLTTYKIEINKIIFGLNSQLLEVNQKIFYFEQITKLPADQYDTLGKLELMNKLSSGSSEDRDFQDKILMYFWSNITDYKTLSAQEINKYANQFVEMK